MPGTNLDQFTRTLAYDGKTVTILRPGLTLAMYSVADIADVMLATADVLDAYLARVPAGAIASTFSPGPDQYTAGRWLKFDAAARADLMRSLRSGTVPPGDEGYSFVLAATPDGQAGDFGVRLGGIDFDADDDDDGETSLLRLDLPWNLVEATDVAATTAMIENLAAGFPFCCGSAGLSFNHTIAYTPETREAIGKLAPRLLGFDLAYDSAQLAMRGKSPPAHWLNLLDPTLVDALGGEGELRSKVPGCPVKSLGGGLVIQGAKYPPVVDVNRGGPDVGLLPVVALALKPIRFSEPTFVGIPDEDAGQEWLDRFDARAPGPWDNG